MSTVSDLAVAQQGSHDSSRYLKLYGAYLEGKDRLNHGFLFQGPDVTIEYGFEKNSEHFIWGYSFGLGGGGKLIADSWSFRWEIAPINAYYLFHAGNIAGNSFLVGPYLSANYNVQNYPDMHTGYLGWLTSYTLGIHLVGSTNIANKDIAFRVQSSVASLVSRPQVNRDLYFFSVSFADVFSDVHSNFRLASFDSFFQGQFEIEMPIRNRRSLSYIVNYDRYTSEPAYQQVSHALAYTWLFGGEK